MRQAGQPVVFGNIPLPKAKRGADRWFNTAAGFFTTTVNRASSLRTFPPCFAGVQAGGQAKWDLSPAVSFRLAGDSALRFRAQRCNRLNHANFSAPDMTPAGTASGRTTATRALRGRLQSVSGWRWGGDGVSVRNLCPADAEDPRGQRHHRPE